MNDLKKQKIWVNWRRDPDRGKIPINCRTGGNAQSDNPQTWNTFQMAEAEKHKYSGTGLMFAGGVCGVDIDGTDGHTNENPLTAELLDLFKGTYIERSPSGSGYHVIFKCDLSQIPTVINKDGKRKLAPSFYQKNPKNGVECYLSGLTSRFFTYTGNRVSEHSEITDQTAEVLYLLNKYMYRGEERINTAILERARNAKNGRKFIALYDNGDTSAYNYDESSADIALCNQLAFYLQGDAAAVDSAFRESALYRPKWERSDYRETTISKAISLCGGEYYKGRGRPRTRTQDEPAKDDFTPDVLSDYLEEKGVSVRFNDITKAVDIEGMENESPEHLQANISAILYSELQSQYRRCTVQTVSAYLDIVASRNRYNPVLDFLDSVEYDGGDYLSELYEILYIPEDDTLSRAIIKKWLWQSISLLHNSPSEPFGADGVLVITGKQGIGKTSLFRKLALKPQFFKEGVALDFRDKDSYIRALSCWIAELGEIETTFRADVERLKAFITQNVDEYRKAYGRGDIRSVRRTSLCGTCNSEEFLIDRSGNRRFWSVAVNQIDLERLLNFNSVQLWKQIQVLSADNLQGFRLTKEEQMQLTERNTEHEKKLKGENEIEDILNADETTSYQIIMEEMTVTTFKQLYSDELRAYTVAQIGKVLDKLGYAAEVKKSGGKTQRLRTLPKRMYKKFY